MKEIENVLSGNDPEDRVVLRKKSSKSGSRSSKSRNEHSRSSHETTQSVVILEEKKGQSSCMNILTS